MTKSQWPQLGFGVGLRTDHYQPITTSWPKVDWFEAVTENFMDSGGRPLQILEQVRHHYPVGLHGTALSIGSSDALNPLYLERLKTLVDRIEPATISDHLCWSGVGGKHLHDLLPLPHTEEAIQHVVTRVGQVQDLLKRPFLLENISTYVTYKHSEMSEWEFLTEIAKRSGCGILLDLNNIYVNSKNHGFDAYEYLHAIPQDFVAQYHLAGHTNMGKFLFDTHTGKVTEAVWDLYREATRLFGPVSCLIEWDIEIPDFETLQGQSETARNLFNEVQGQEPTWKKKVKKKEVQNSSSGPDLKETEEWFQEHVFTHEAKDSESLLNPQGGDPGVERLSVYSDGFKARMKEGLEDVYKATAHVMGEGAFTSLAEAYASSYQSHDYNLSEVGRDLALFTTKTPWSEKLPFLPDLIRLEWLVSRSFHAFDGKPLIPEKFSSVDPSDWGKLCLVFQPSVHVFKSEWPLLDIWESRNTPVGEIKVQLENRPQNILIRRKGGDVICRLMDRKQYNLLKGLLVGKNLALVCDEFEDQEEGEDLLLTEWFSAWMSESLIQGIDLAKTDSTPI